MRIITLTLLLIFSLIVFEFSKKNIPSNSSPTKSDSIPRKNDISSANLKGSVKSTTDTVFDAVERNGEVVKGYINGITITNYNLLGYITGTIYKHPGEMTESERIPKYNKKGFVIGSETYNSVGSIVGEESCICDDKGNIIERTIFDGKREMTRKSTMLYDSLDNKIEMNEYVSSCDCSVRTLYTYDDKGNEIERNETQSNFSTGSRSSYKYDENSNMVEWNDYRDGRFLWKGTIKYVKFDSIGNWTKRVSYFEGKYASMVTERVIEYYP